MENLLSTQEQLKSGELKLPDLARSYLDIIKSKNPEINAFTAYDEDSVLKQAADLQKKIDSGKAGQLAGAVVGVKDVISEKGKKLTCSSNILENFEAVYNATVIDKLHSQDALLIGRLNMDEFAMGSSTENSIHGSTKNPQDVTKVPGGSSGGSAAAVAAGMCNVSLGSDTGGSIRQPASYCGVVGLKPTYSRVSRYGLVAYASSFDSIGPFAHNVTDAAVILEHISGHDPHDNSSSDRKVERYSEGLDDLSGKLTVGVPKEYFSDGLDSEIKA